MKPRPPALALLTILFLTFILVACPGTPGPVGPQPVDITVTGTVSFDTGGPVAGASISGSSNEVTQNGLRTLQSVDTVTDAAGNFTVTLNDLLPTKVAVDISFVDPTTTVVVNSAKTATATTATIDFDIVIPNPDGAEIIITGGSGTSDDGAIEIEGLPTEVDTLFGRSYDPDATPEAFPGEFAESGQIPLNSSNFLWMEALDADGDPVDDFVDAVTIRTRVPESQWVDLEDIENGTDRIEVPMYSFDEASQVWLQMDGTGWLEDESRRVISEDTEPQIVAGTFVGEIFAVFETGHLSWMNVDYAYIGPWTLSRMGREQRNNDCLFNALQLARTIAMSQAGRAAYAKYNLPGGDLDVELADGAGPELKNDDLTDEYGEFKGNEQGDRDDQFYIGNAIWDGCGEGATANQKKNATLLMAVTILHESAHWKWDVKHEGGDWKNAEPGGEAGNTLEKDLFGGIITLDGNTLKRDGNPVPNATRDNWLDPSSWPAPPAGGIVTPAQLTPEQTSDLAITITLAQTVIDLGDEIPVTVEYENISSADIEVMDLMVLEGYPLWFEIVEQGSTTRVPFRGTRAKLDIDFDRDFVTLAPGATLQKTVNLIRDPGSGAQRYNLIMSGDYQITAYYSGNWGVAEAQSNTVNITVGVGGSVTGTITNAGNALPIENAAVQAIQGIDILATATTDSLGAYTFPELPGGTYSIEAGAPGFLRNMQEGVVVTNGVTTVVDLSLSPLLATGQLQLVLTWGASPSDLDSHLWLPDEVPYHLYYGRTGLRFDPDKTVCPWAELDVDDTSGFGPETTTIYERVNTGSYVYAVYNFSSSPDITTSEAQVQVFDATGLIATFDIPTSGVGLWWHVLDIDGTTGAISEINEIVDGGDDSGRPAPGPYDDTDAGCLPTPTLRAPGSAGKR